MLVLSMEVWNISLPFGILYVNLVILWQFGVFAPFLVLLYQEKSGNPELCCPTAKSWS
jgi:hypothetical protein